LWSFGSGQFFVFGTRECVKSGQGVADGLVLAHIRRAKDSGCRSRSRNKDNNNKT